MSLPGRVPAPPAGSSALRGLLLLLVLLLVGRHLVLVLRAIVLSDPVDLGAYYLHARMLWEGANPGDAAKLMEYGERLGLRPLRGVNPPTFYFLFLPFALLPWPAARVLWVLLSEAALWGMGAIAWRELTRRGADRVVSALVVAGFAAVFYPAKQALALGQVDLLLGLAVAFMGLALAKGRSAAAGLLALLLGGVKIQLGAVIVFLALAGRLGRGAGAVALFGLVWLGGVLAVFGHQAVVSYLQFLAAHLGGGLNPDPTNYSLNGLLARTLLPRAGPSVAGAVYTLLAGAVTLASLWAIFSRRSPPEEGRWLWVGFLFLTVWMISPFSEEHHLAWVIVPLLVAAFERAPRAGRGEAGLFLLALLLSGVEHYPHSLWTGPGLLPDLLRSSKLLGPAVLWALSFRALIGFPAAPGRGVGPPSAA